MSQDTALRTIRETTKFAKENGYPKLYQSYGVIYGLVRAGKIPVVKLGNRYLLRVCDIEKYLLDQAAPVTGNIRRID